MSNKKFSTLFSDWQYYDKGMLTPASSISDEWYQKYSYVYYNFDNFIQGLFDGSVGGIDEYLHPRSMFGDKDPNGVERSYYNANMEIVSDKFTDDGLISKIHGVGNKLIFNIGGWNTISDMSFSLISEMRRQRIVDGVKSLVNLYSLDGIFIDWSYDGDTGWTTKYGEIGDPDLFHNPTPEDEIRIVKLLKMIKEQIPDIDIHISLNIDYTHCSYDIVSMNEYVDLFTFKAFFIADPISYNIPLRSSDDRSFEGTSIEECINQFAELQIPRNKMNISMASYSGYNDYDMRDFKFSVGKLSDTYLWGAFWDLSQQVKSIEFDDEQLIILERPDEIFDKGAFLEDSGVSGVVDWNNSSLQISGMATVVEEIVDGIEDEVPRYEIVVQQPDKGTIFPGNKLLMMGTSFMYSVTPDEFYYVKNIVKNGTLYPGDIKIRVETIDTGYTITAIIEKIVYKVNINQEDGITWYDSDNNVITTDYVEVEANDPLTISYSVDDRHIDQGYTISTQSYTFNNGEFIFEHVLDNIDINIDIAVNYKYIDIDTSNCDKISFEKTQYSVVYSDDLEIPYTMNNPCYYMDNVIGIDIPYTINGDSIQIPNVTHDIVISPVNKISTKTITVNGDVHTTLSSNSFRCGSSLNFNIYPNDTKYIIDYIKINGVLSNSKGVISLDNVINDLVIDVAVKEDLLDIHVEKDDHVNIDKPIDSSVLRHDPFDLTITVDNGYLLQSVTSNVTNFTVDGDVYHWDNVSENLNIVIKDIIETYNVTSNGYNCSVHTDKSVVNYDDSVTLYIDGFPDSHEFDRIECNYKLIRVSDTEYRADGVTTDIEFFVYGRIKTFSVSDTGHDCTISVDKSTVEYAGTVYLSINNIPESHEFDRIDSNYSYTQVSSNRYKFENITSDLTIDVYAKIKTYNVTTSTDYVTIHTDKTSVDYGDSVTLYIDDIPQSRNIDNVTSNHKLIRVSDTEYRVDNVTSDVSFSVTSVIKTYNVNDTGHDCTIHTDKDIVDYDDSVTLYIDDIPISRYFDRIESNYSKIKISDTEYKFNNITSDINIDVYTNIKQYSVSTDSHNCTISVDKTTVDYGDSVILTIDNIPESHEFDKIISNYSYTQISPNEYRFDNITSDLSIDVYAKIRTFTVTSNGHDCNIHTNVTTVDYGANVILYIDSMDISRLLDSISSNYPYITITPDEVFEFKNITSDINIDVYTKIKTFTVTVKGDSNCNFPDFSRVVEWDSDITTDITFKDCWTYDSYSLSYGDSDYPSSASYSETDESSGSVTVTNIRSDTDVLFSSKRIIRSVVVSNLNGSFKLFYSNLDDHTFYVECGDDVFIRWSGRPRMEPKISTSVINDEPGSNYNIELINDDGFKYIRVPNVTGDLDISIPDRLTYPDYPKLWKSTTTYQRGDEVRYSGYIYKSKSDNNKNKKPSNRPGYWEKIISTSIPEFLFLKGVNPQIQDADHLDYVEYGAIGYTNRSKLLSSLQIDIDTSAVKFYKVGTYKIKYSSNNDYKYTEIFREYEVIEPKPSVCQNYPEWDPNKDWTEYNTGDRVVNANKLWECKDTAYATYEPSGPNGHYGWDFVSDC